MKRSQVVHLTLVTTVAALLTGCEERARRYCVDSNHEVSDDRHCNLQDYGYNWYFVRGYGSVGNGTVVTGGSYTEPANGYTSRSGETVRGVIGGAGEAAGGDGGAGE